MAKRVTEFSWEVLDALLQRGSTCTDCAHIMDCSTDTIERKIKEEYEIGFKEYRDKRMAKTRAKLVEVALSKAFNKDNTMLIFCLKNLCMWKDKHEPETVITGEPSRLTIEFSKEEETKE